MVEMPLLHVAVANRDDFQTQCLQTPQLLSRYVSVETQLQSLHLSVYQFHCQITDYLAYSMSAYNENWIGFKK